jgi:glycosyltransferase involved in cell wall biosynthesis
VGGISFYGWLGLDKLELWFLKHRGIHTVCVCGGGDAYALGNIRNSSLRHALQSSYPERSRMHIEVERSVRIWEQKADIFIADKMILDGIARSDLISPHVGVVDTEYLATFHSNSMGDRRNHSSPIKIIHAPNHRYFKGTEYIFKAISDLTNKGYNIDFVLIENMETTLLLNEIANSDIVIDQIIMPGYANFAIESMALGKPVVCNLEMPEFRELMTRYSFLNQCPIVSASPETLVGALEKLILDQKLRDNLGQLGINFSKKFHSFSAWQKLWNEFESENFNGANLSQKNLFHPLSIDFLAE